MKKRHNILGGGDNILLEEISLERSSWATGKLLVKEAAEVVHLTQVFWGIKASKELSTTNYSLSTFNPRRCPHLHSQY